MNDAGFWVAGVFQRSNKNFAFNGTSSIRTAPNKTSDTNTLFLILSAYGLPVFLCVPCGHRLELLFHASRE